MDVAKWANEKPQEAAEFFTNFSNKERADGLQKVGKVWVDNSPEDALSWARSMRDGPARDEVLRQFTHIRASADLDSTIAHLRKLPSGSGRNAAIEGFAFAVFDTAPDTVFEWVRKIDSVEAKNDIFLRSWRNWRRKNSVAASDWLLHVGPLSEEERDVFASEVSR